MVAWLVALASMAAAQAKPAEAKTGVSAVVSEADLKRLKEHNIYSPRSPKREVRIDRDRRGGTSSSGPSSAPPVELKPKPPVLTGLVFDEKAGGHVALVEDRNPVPAREGDRDLRLFKEPRFLKAGDTLLVYTIETVTADSISLTQGEAKKELRVGESFPDIPGTTSSTPAPAAAPSAAPAPAEAKPEVRTEAKTETPSTGESAEDILKKLRDRNKKNRE
jgi:hypothetical protein